MHSMRIDQNLIARIIGYKGSVMENIKTEFHCKIEIDQSTKDSGYSTLFISSIDQPHLNKAITKIQSILDESYQIKLKLNSHQTRLLIGPKGNTLKALQEKFQVHLQFDQSTSDKILKITGIKDKVEFMHQKIKEFIKGKFNPMRLLVENYVEPKERQETNISDPVMRRFKLSEDEKDVLTRNLYGLQMIRKISLAKIAIDHRSIAISGPEFTVLRAEELLRSLYYFALEEEEE
jgi:polyribonucleotide nucleotidyltransferase